MKVNKMPEKIYIFDYNDAMVTPLEGDTIYVREDAFIEKSCEKLRQLMYDSLMYQGRLERDKVINNFIEDFKKRIKGD